MRRRHPDDPMPLDEIFRDVEQPRDVEDEDDLDEILRPYREQAKKVHDEDVE